MSNQNINSQTQNNKISNDNDNDNDKIPSWDPFTPSNNSEETETEKSEPLEQKEIEEPEIEEPEIKEPEIEEPEIEEPKQSEKNKRKENSDNEPITNNNKLTPLEAINEFYELKSKYESTNFNKYIKPILKSNKSKREKKMEYSKLPKFPCINCKRNVNTIFKITYDKDNLLHKYTAKCGDLQDPCPLNIEIDYAIGLNLQLEIKENFDKIEKIKTDIIKEKNNAIFFKDSSLVLSNFEKLTNELKEETEYFGSFIEENILK